MPISSFSNPIPELIQGLLQGHALGLQMHNQRMADQKFKTDQALREQNMSMQDIMNQRALGDMGRPVSDMGTVSTPQTGVASMPSGVPIAGLDTQAGNPGYPDYTRKADASRTVKYTNQQGTKMATELYTPEEQDQAAANKAVLLKRANSTMLRLSPEDQQKYGFASPEVPIPNDHVAQYFQSRVGNEVKQNIADSNNLTKTDSNIRNNDTRRDTTDANNTTKTDIAAGVQTGANSRTAATNVTREKVGAGNNAATVQAAAGNNAATLGAANIRAAGGGTGTGTPGQKGVQSRFDQRRADIAQKAIDTIQAKENVLHAQRVQIGQNPGATGTPARAQSDAKLKSLTFQIGAYQTQKAKAAGASQPPAEAETQADSPALKAKYPLGVPMTSPDGHSWLRKDGITYFQK